ncbi:Uncharacterized protein OS=uncultured bacterium PE=4 SV=1 [Gemmataceae bacterium]|nr:Uncharacterized protein OS=uncultured bacterium PE=4 SV=1 [Gemmataceae bacterium]VTT98685.1 Uncharacterized protein OS=uncultured bacterium PE=4 SV=1 [Gemmataceae bacterium]
MTEQEWLNCTDPIRMLEFLRDKASKRKLRLFACAWGYELWSRMTDQRSRNALITAERFADGLCDVEVLRACFKEAWEARTKASTWATQAALTACYDGYDVDRAVSQVNYEMVKVRRGNGLPERLQCLFGNPFCPVTADPTWLTSTVVALARGIYEDRAFERMPILADALQDAGCDNADILDHCRGPGPHVRGCWVVDLLLGKG